MSDSRLVTVEYQYASYSGSVVVPADENDDTDMIVARAKHIMRRHMTLPMAYESWKVQTNNG